MKNILAELDDRGLIFDITDKEGLKEKLNEGPITLYVGFDPTADSLHIGSLLPILTLRRFQLAGHKVIALVGGATGLIGDPSGKKQERTLNDEDTVEKWSTRLTSQLERFIDLKEGKGEVLNNFWWTGSMNTIDFLRDLGKHFSVNSMLAKESVSTRLESGISFTEFAYMILQSNDFLRLFQRRNCVLQIGGSDQWGNITTGIDLIRKVQGQKAFGLTIPLVTKADGTKFGKTESGTIWLDKNKTSVYQFYQFWLNTADADVFRFLDFFTFIDVNELGNLQDEHRENPGARIPHKILAKEVTNLVHGTEETERAIKMSNVLFGGDIKELSVDEIKEVFERVPSTNLSLEQNRDIVSILVESAICSSKRQAREDIVNGAITINGDKVTQVDKEFNRHELFGREFLIIRRGKKNYFLVKFE